MRSLFDHQINENFSADYGAGLSFDWKGETFTTHYDGDYPRRLLLDITTWRGMTSGAMHFYGEIKIASVQCLDSDGKKWRLRASAPEKARGLKIQLTRPLNKRDLRLDRGQRFKGAQVGEAIRNFDSVEDVEKAALQLIENHFEDGWELIKIVPGKLPVKVC